MHEPIVLTIRGFDWYCNFWQQASIACEYLLSTIFLFDSLLGEFQAILESLIYRSKKVIIDDRNIQVNAANQCSSAFLQLMNRFDMQQLITFPPHNKGHTRDVVITHSDSQLLSCATFAESHLSNHTAIFSKSDFDLLNFHFNHHQITRFLKFALGINSI